MIPKTAQRDGEKESYLLWFFLEREFRGKEMDIHASTLKQRFTLHSERFSFLSLSHDIVDLSRRRFALVGRRDVRTLTRLIEEFFSIDT
jgi:hypothetical protein